MKTPISQEILDADRASLEALREMEGYTALNPLYSLETLNGLEEAMDRADDDVLRFQRLLAAARDTKANTSRSFHSGMIGAKTNVSAQYGPDSPEVQAIGLKKKSEYKRPARRRNTQPGT